jgi:O-antigen/teichoic acid export membrane protein
MLPRETKLTTDNPTPVNDLATKTVKGSVYSIGASAITMVLGFGRSVLMARLLTPEDFGVVAFALTFLSFTTPLRDFGLDQALIHRKPDQEVSLDDALAVHFTLRLILIGLFILLLLGAIPLLRRVYPDKPLLPSVLMALTVGEIATALSATPTTYLRKEMQFKELAILQVLTSLSMTIVGPLMAWQGWGVWAIVGERISGVMMATLVTLIFIRPWQLRWRFNHRLVKWYLNYGKFVFVNRYLTQTLNEFDDFWIGNTLGSQSLGFYSKSYELAGYPRRIISDPLATVLFPVFAKAQDDRNRLSKAYFRVSSLLVRLGFLFVGVLVLGAPFFVPFLFGAQWVPMTRTFQLMIIYTLLDPLVSISGNLVNAVGHPEFGTKARFVQVLFFIPSVVFGSKWEGINGVAVVTDGALLLGFIVLLYQARNLVDISISKLLLFPSVALIIGTLMSLGTQNWITKLDALHMIILEVAVFVLVYSSILVLLERKEYLSKWRMLYELLCPPRYRRDHV